MPLQFGLWILSYLLIAVSWEFNSLDVGPHKDNSWALSLMLLGVRSNGLGRGEEKHSHFRLRPRSDVCQCQRKLFCLQPFKWFILKTSLFFLVVQRPGNDTHQPPCLDALSYLIAPMMVRPWPASCICWVPYWVNTILTAATSYKTSIYPENTSVTTKKYLWTPLICVV